jgi:hypothetical protein
MSAHQTPSNGWLLYYTQGKLNNDSVHQARDSNRKRAREARFLIKHLLHIKNQLTRNLPKDIVRTLRLKQQKLECKLTHYTSNDLSVASRTDKCLHITERLEDIDLEIRHGFSTSALTQERQLLDNELVQEWNRIYSDTAIFDPPKVNFTANDNNPPLIISSVVLPTVLPEEEKHENYCPKKRRRRKTVPPPLPTRKAEFNIPEISRDCMIMQIAEIRSRGAQLTANHYNFLASEKKRMIAQNTKITIRRVLRLPENQLTTKERETHIELLKDKALTEAVYKSIQTSNLCNQKRLFERQQIREFINTFIIRMKVFAYDDLTPMHLLVTDCLRDGHENGHYDAADVAVWREQIKIHLKYLKKAQSLSTDNISSGTKLQDQFTSIIENFETEHNKLHSDIPEIRRKATLTFKKQFQSRHF